MKIVKKNPEAALQILLKAVADDRTGWHGFLFMPSPMPDYEEMIAPPHHIAGRLHKLNIHAASLAGALLKKSPPLKDGSAFVFPGGLVIIVVRADLFDLYSETAKKSGAQIARLGDLDDGLEKHLAPFRKRMAVYDAVADIHKVRSIGFRRNRHKDGVALVVDDDKFVSAYAANLLKNDYDVISVRDGEEALCAYIKYAPNIVLLDIHMPGIGGLRTLGALRIIDDSAPVIVMSEADGGDGGDGDLFAAARAGAAGCLRKPLAKDKLLAAIRGAPGMKKFSPAGKSAGKR
jgi:CheY-like chemotaxis protein